MCPLIPIGTRRRRGGGVAAAARALALFSLLPLLFSGTAEAACALSGADCPTGRVVALEWYIDLDPDAVRDHSLLPAGNTVAVSLDASACMLEEAEFDIPAAVLDSLLPGYHTLYVRAQEEGGVWSEFRTTLFEVVRPLAAPPATGKVFFDEDTVELDPETAAGTVVAFDWENCSPVGGSPYWQAEVEVDASILDTGSHGLAVALEDQSGFFSVPESATFLVEENLLCPPTLLVDSVYREENCSDGLDDDGDGQVDADDPECPNSLASPLVFFDEVPDGCFPGHRCFEAVIEPAKYRFDRAFLEFCVDHGELGGLWLDLLGESRLFSVLELPFSEPMLVTLTANVPEQFVRITVPPGAALTIVLSDPLPEHVTTLLARFGAAPTDAFHDYVGVPGADGTTRLVVRSRSTESQTLFLRLGSDDFPGDVPFNVTIEAIHETEPVVLERITPEVGTAGAPCGFSGVVLGAGFENAPAFSLRQSGGGSVLDLCSQTIVTRSRAEVVVDMEGAALGLYDLVATVPPDGTEVVLSGAFTVEAPALVGLLEVELTGQDSIRRNKPGRLTLKYRNVGGEELPARLFVVEAPAGVELRLHTMEEFGGNVLVVLAGNPGGVPGRIPPGAAGEIPIIFRSTSPGLQMAQFKVFELKRDPGMSVEWATLGPPAGMTQPQWDQVSPLLSDMLGATWLEYENALGALAGRLVRRGCFPASVPDFFRFAVREAYGRPSSAILGTLLTANGTPIRDAKVVALLPGDEPASTAVTDAAGTFALDWLEPGMTYELVVHGHAFATPVSVTMPGAGEQEPDVAALELYAEEATNALPEGCTACDESGLPDAPVVPPPDALAPVTFWNVRVFTSLDPSGKIGPEGNGDIELGDGETPLVALQEEIDYTIVIENEVGQDPVQEIRIVDYLPVELDPSTIVVREVALAGYVRPIDVIGADRTTGYASGLSLGQQVTYAGGPRFPPYTEFSMMPAVAFGFPPPTEPVTVAVEIAVNPVPDSSAYEIVWEFKRASGSFLSYEGLLAGNDAAGNGIGHVSFSVMANQELAQSAADEIEIINTAVVTFDQNEEFQVGTTIKLKLPPQVPRLPSPEDGGQAPASGVSYVRWQARRAEKFDVYLWRCTEPLPPATRPADDDPSMLVAQEDWRYTLYPITDALQGGADYCWQVVAKNFAGTAEGPIWHFTTASSGGKQFRRGDSNSDGKNLDLSDAVYILQYLFAQGPDVMCEDAADSNDDQQVDLGDAVYILQNLFASGPDIPPPYPGCGVDETEDTLTCEEYPHCP